MSTQKSQKNFKTNFFENFIFFIVEKLSGLNRYLGYNNTLFGGALGECYIEVLIMNVELYCIIALSMSKVDNVVDSTAFWNWTKKYALFNVLDGGVQIEISTIYHSTLVRNHLSQISLLPHSFMFWTYST